MNRKLPAGKSAYKDLPDFIKSVVDTAAEALKGRPWYFAFEEIHNFKKIIENALASGQQLSEDETQNLNFPLSCMVAALIERLGGHPKRCEDANQAFVYSDSAREDHHRAAKQYEKKVGGVDAMQREMSDWVKNHQAEIASHVEAATAMGGEYPGDGPITMEEVLSLWTDRAIEQFSAQGSVDPLMLGLRQDGSGMLFTKKGFRSAGEKEAFKQLVYSQCEKAGLGRIVTIIELWSAPAEAGVKPSQPAQREEVVLVEVKDGEEAIGNYLRIERDRKTGAPTLLPPERIDQTHTS